MSDEAKVWRWVGEDGVEKSVSEQELIAGLSSETIPNYSLVWRKGWGEWVPAMRVAELAWTLPPGKADEPVEPKEKPGAEQPPAPPLYRYPVIKRRARALRSDQPPPKRPSQPERSPPREKKENKQKLKLPRPQGASGAPVPRPQSSAPRATPAPSQAKPGRPPGKPPPSLSRPRSAEPKPPESAEIFEIEEVEAVSSPDATATIEPDEEVEEVEAVLEESQPPNPPVEQEARFEVASSAVAGQAYGEEFDDEETRVLSAKPEGEEQTTYVAPHLPPPSEGPPPGHREPPELPKIPPPPPPPADLQAPGARAQALLERVKPLLERVKPLLERVKPLLERLEPLVERVKAMPRYAHALGGLIVLLLIVLIALIANRGSEEPAATAEVEPETAPSAEATASGAPATRQAAKAPPRPAAAKAEPESPPRPCTIETAATRLGERASVFVPPSLAEVPGSSRVAIGYAANAEEAIGITIDPVSLDKDQVYRQTRRKNPVISVVPITAGDTLKFHITRSKDALSRATTVNFETPFVVGLASGGVSTAPISGGAPKVVWPLDGEEKTTTLRTATVPGKGHAVTFRKGGKTGTVHVGWLSADGKTKSDLGVVADEQEFVGTPDIAVNGSSVLVAFAAKGARDADWSVHLATAEHGKVPKRAGAFRLPKGGPGSNAISPAAAGLPGDRWLLQWTEGASGNRVVRVQVLDARLEHVVEPLDLSPKDENSGQGTLWVKGERIVSLFFVRGEDSHELWGTSVKCPK